MSIKVTVRGPTDTTKRAFVSGSGVPATFVASGETKEFTASAGPLPAAVHVSEVPAA
ncbi:hypothetical protein [Bradyrhizobium sp. McL0615]|uniref:hypothetical protein n=1 Tax=Bradyrhizobium sp. McL0615 TaxID=3415673 RepID=UPI003CF0A272